VLRPGNNHCVRPRWGAGWKLRFIAEKTPDSMQGFITKVLFPAIDKKIEELTRTQDGKLVAKELKLGD